MGAFELSRNAATWEFEEKLSRKEEEIRELNLALENVRNFMESTMQSIGSGIILTEMNDTITYMNRAGEKILGYSKQEVVGKPFGFLGLKEKPSIVQSLLDHPDVLDARKEGWMQGKNGINFPVGFTMNNHLNIQGETIGRIIVFRDLTKVYKIQEEILRMDRLVSLGKLASGIAHELRNPLAGIKTTAQALSEEMGEEDSRKEYLNRITKEIDRLNELLKAFFSFAKPQNLQLTHCHIKDIINTIIPFLLREISDKGIRFVESYDPQLPKIRMDKNQMHQAFLNLFLNALQAMPNGGELKIKVHSTHSDTTDGVRQNFIEIIISDTGKGIPSHFIPKIFDPFFTTRPRGVGLGLSITYQIIKKHGGSIKVESEWEKGTSFIINLPERLDN